MAKFIKLILPSMKRQTQTPYLDYITLHNKVKKTMHLGIWGNKKYLRLPCLFIGILDDGLKHLDNSNKIVLELGLENLTGNEVHTFGLIAGRSCLGAARIMTLLWQNTIVSCTGYFSGWDTIVHKWHRNKADLIHFGSVN